jgi:tRNA dimethylallyltransferase
MKRQRAILIAGPTAAGKSALALTLAQRHRGVIINADSMQVYRDLRVLTARPSDRELDEAPHALYGHVPGDVAYSVGLWLQDATAALEAAWTEERIPIVVGGTGLYFKALLEGLAPIPDIPGPIRAHWREAAARLGAEGLHRLLAERDPAMAGRLRPGDTQRLTRALEVLEATGRSLADWQREAGHPLLREAEAERYVVAPDRASVQARADARLDAMIAGGALDEVRRLAALGLPRDLPVMRALGVAPLLDVLAGHASLEAAVARAKLDTRRYIKRQETWLRRNMITWKLVKT